jgi:hypothetical protein
VPHVPFASKMPLVCVCARESVLFIGTPSVALALGAFTVAACMLQVALYDMYLICMYSHTHTHTHSSLSFSFSLFLFLSLSLSRVCLSVCLSVCLVCLEGESGQTLSLSLARSLSVCAYLSVCLSLCLSGG